MLCEHIHSYSLATTRDRFERDAGKRARRGAAHRGSKRQRTVTKGTMGTATGYRGTPVLRGGPGCTASRRLCSVPQPWSKHRPSMYCADVHPMLAACAARMSPSTAACPLQTNSTPTVKHDIRVLHCLMRHAGPSCKERAAVCACSNQATAWTGLRSMLAVSYR